MAWYKIVMERSIVVYHGISHELLEGSCVCRAIFHRLPLESVAQLVFM